MPEITSEFIARQIERFLEEQQKLRAASAEFRAVLEVQSAIIRRLEIRALTGQQERRRPKLERHEIRLERLEKATAE